MSSRLPIETGKHVLLPALALLAASLLMFATTGAAERGEVKGIRSPDTTAGGFDDFASEVAGGGDAGGNDAQGSVAAPIHSHVPTDDSKTVKEDDAPTGEAREDDDHDGSETGDATPSSSEAVTPGANAPNSSPSSPSQVITVSEGTNKLQVVDDQTWQKSLEKLDQVMANTGIEIAKELTGLYSQSKKGVEDEISKMIGVVQLLQSDSEQRIDLLVKRERRLEVTMMHGEFGKCCCSAPEVMATSPNANNDTKPQCSWSIGPVLLGKYSKKCEKDKHAYTEFLAEPQAGYLQDNMLDQCSQTPDWQQYTSNQIVNECGEYSRQLGAALDKSVFAAHPAE